MISRSQKQRFVNHLARRAKESYFALGTDGVGNADNQLRGTYYVLHLRAEEIRFGTPGETGIGAASRFNHERLFQGVDFGTVGNRDDDRIAADV